MTLKQWLDTHHLSAAWCAKQLGATPSALSLWLSGKRAPNLRYLQAIHRLTDGEVGLMDWQDEDERAEGANAEA